MYSISVFKVSKTNKKVQCFEQNYHTRAN